MSAAAETVAAAPRKTAATRSNTVLYTALTLLFLVATSYYVRTLEYRFPQWFGVTTAGMPFHLNTEDQSHFVLFPQPNAQAAGLRYGDLLIRASPNLCTCAKLRCCSAEVTSTGLPLPSATMSSR